MACPPKKSGDKKRRKRLPSINPFFHFLKHMWKAHKGCKKSVVVAMAVKKWQCMSQCEKQPFYNAACRAQRMLKKAKKCQKPKPKCSKPKPKPKPRAKQKCPKPKPKPKCPKKKSMKPRCPPCPPPCPPPSGNQKK